MVFGASRRRALKGALAAGTAAFIAACGGGSKNESGGSSGSSGSSGGSGTPTTGGKVVENVVAKVTPGQYEKKIAASQEELDEAKTAKRGGTLKARYLEPPHFDAALNFSCTIYDTHELSYNKAIRAKLGPKADPFKLELEPDLAEKWEQTAPDATEFVFSFRKNAKWHNREPLNGRPFTAEDAKLVFERYQSGGALKDFFSMVDKWEQPDQYTLRAKLKEPYVDFPASIATYAYITPKELWFNSDKIKTEVVGTGPFIRTSWTPKEKSTFVKNPDYFEMAPDGKPYPYVDAIELWISNDAAAQKAGFRSGNWQFHSATSTDDGKDILKSTPDTVWLDLPNSRGGNVNGFFFQMNNPRWKDKRVRNAISMGIDRQAYDDLFRDGLNKGYSSTAMPWTFVRDELPTLKDQGPWFQYNPAEAKKLLQAAGMDKLDFEIVEWYITSTQDLFSPMQDQLREIGVSIKDKKVDNPTAVRTLGAKDFPDAANMIWGPPNYSIDGWLYPFYVTGGGLNYNSVSDPQLDAMLKAQRKEANAAKRKEILKQIDAHLNDMTYDIWYPQAWVREMWPAWVKNYRSHGFAGTSQCYAMSQFRQVWMDKG